MKRKWTQKEVDYLKANYSKSTPSICARSLNRTIHAVKQKSKRLNVASERKPFVKHEIEYIKEHYVDLGPDYICKKLGRNKSSIQAVAHRLGLKMTLKARGKISSQRLQGHKLSEETKRKIGQANRVHLSPKCCIDCGAEIMRKSTRCPKCASLKHGGEGHNWWNGGMTSLNQIAYNMLYPVWKFPILQRDGFRCQNCGDSQHLEVHHLRLFNDIRSQIINENPHLSIEIYEDKIKLAKLIVLEHAMEDGITLCRPCHEKEHWEKSGELLEHPNAIKGEDNQQPSPPKLKLIVGGKAQRLTGEDSATNKPDTSARVAEGNMI